MGVSVMGVSDIEAERECDFPSLPSICKTCLTLEMKLVLRLRGDGPEPLLDTLTESESFRPKMLFRLESPIVLNREEEGEDPGEALGRRGVTGEGVSDLVDSVSFFSEADAASVDVAAATGSETPASVAA